MKKAYLFCFLLLILNGCSEEVETIKFDILKEVSNIIISGEGTVVYFSGEKAINNDQSIVIDDVKEVETLLDTLKQATPPSSGGMTAERPGLQINIIYKDNTKDTFDFWFRPEKKTGRFEDNNGRIFLIKKQDITIIETLLKKNAAK